MDIKALSKVTQSGEKVKDSKRISDSARIQGAKRRTFKRKLKDELTETESTEEAVDVVIAALEDASPEEVLEAVVEILGETIDMLDTNQGGEDEEEPEEEPEEEHLEDSRKMRRGLKQKHIKDKNIRNRPLRKVKDGDPGDDFKVEKGDIVKLQGGPIKEIIVLGFSGDGEIGSKVLVHDTGLEANPEAIQDLIDEPQGLTLSRMNELMFGEGDEDWWDEMHGDSPANSVALDVFEITGAYRCKDISTGKSYSMYVKVD